MMYSNFVQKVWYTPPSQTDETKPVQFLLKSLTYRFIDLLVQLQVNPEMDLKLNIREYIVEHCIVDYRNISSDDSKEYVMEHLQDLVPTALVDEVVGKVQELWDPTHKFMDSLKITVELMLDPRFADASWNCTKCQALKLDKQRNCPYLNSDTYDLMYKLPFMGQLLTVCPVAQKNESLGKTLIEAFNFREIQALPEKGGMGDQSIMFVLGSQQLADRILYFKNKDDKPAK